MPPDVTSAMGTRFEVWRLTKARRRRFSRSFSGEVRDEGIVAFELSALAMSSSFEEEEKMEGDMVSTTAAGVTWIYRGDGGIGFRQTYDSIVGIRRKLRITFKRDGTFRTH